MLDDIPGDRAVPEGRHLMRHFKNIEAIRNADMEELKKLPSMNEQIRPETYITFSTDVVE